jgi:hypothetical protein
MVFPFLGSWTLGKAICDTGGLDMPKMMSLKNAIAVIAFFFPIEANAFVGAVKVDCPDNNCDAVTLGEICNTMANGSHPIGLSCENTATPGRGVPDRTCGVFNGKFGTCTQRPLFRNDVLGSHCFGSPVGEANDAVVICDTSTLLNSQ